MPEEIKQRIHDLYPDFPNGVICDFTHVLEMNIRHIPTAIKSREGMKVVDHEEKMIGFGTGFDWLHIPNFALLVNPVAIDPEIPLVTSGKLLLTNFELERIKAEEGALIMISTSYRKDEDRLHSQIKARDLANYAYSKLQAQLPDLFTKYNVKFAIGTMDQKTRLFESLYDIEDLPDFVFPKIPDELLDDNHTKKYVIDHNKKASKEFTNPYQRDLRNVYRVKHPTEIMVFKCMDGRINLPIITGVPVGIFQPMRNIGAKFSMGWKACYDEVKAWKEYALENGRGQCLALVTYHYSEHDLKNPDAEHKFGCAGHGYDTEAAKKNAFDLATELRYTFGEGKDAFFSVAVIGINTDNDSIVVHGQHGEEISMADYAPVKEEVCA